MNILLINDNPVVSRLLALCTREEYMILEEVSGHNLDIVLHTDYDVVFIDEGSYEAEAMNLLEKLIITKKILLSNEEKINDFDLTIAKPFLPSQIIEILDSIKAEDSDISQIHETTDMLSISPLASKNLERTGIQEKGESSKETEEETLLGAQVLDINEIDKIKALLEMEEESSTENDILSHEEIERRKVQAIKEQLIADGLEIVEEEEIVDILSQSDDLIGFPSSEERKKKSKKKKSSKKHTNKKHTKKKNNKKKDLEFTKEELGRIEDTVHVAIATLKYKQIKKLLRGKKIEVSIRLKDTN